MMRAMPVGQYIRGLRDYHGWSLRELARRADVNASTLSRIENGHDFQFSHLTKLASALGLQVGDLLTQAGWTTGNGERRSVTACTSYYIRLSCSDEQPPLCEVVQVYPDFVSEDSQ